jgi:two-component system sensor histidine kinase BarA
MAIDRDTKLGTLAVLAADDHAVNRDFLRVGLASRVGALELVASGREAVRACARREFDVVLMDLHMPDMDGLSAWQRIRREATGRPPRVLALTADSRPDQHERLRAHGFRGVLHKPVMIESLLAALIAVAGDDHGFVEPDEMRHDPAPLLDADRAARAAGTPRRAVEMQQALARELTEGVAEIDGLIADGRHAEAAELLHRWSGAAGYSGAMRFREASARLERCLREGLDSAPGRLYFEWRRTLAGTLAAMAATQG